MRSTLIVFIGSGIGGVARRYLNLAVASFLGTGFPRGILIINVLGSTAIGTIAGLFAFRADIDTALLCERGEPGLAALYVGASVALSLIGVFGGLWAVR